MATKEELFTAVRLIREHCRNRANHCECCGCPLYVSIDVGCTCRSIVPGCWPDPEEGGVKVEKNICFECKHASEFPVCPAATDDVVFASNGDTIVNCKAYEETEGGGEK